MGRLASAPRTGGRGLFQNDSRLPNRDSPARAVAAGFASDEPFQLDIGVRARVERLRADALKPV